MDSRRWVRELLAAGRWLCVFLAILLQQKRATLALHSLQALDLRCLGFGFFLDEPDAAPGWSVPLPLPLPWDVGGCQWWKYIEGEGCGSRCCADGTPGCVGGPSPPALPGNVVFKLGRC